MYFLNIDAHSQKQIRGGLLMSSKLIDFHKTFHHTGPKTEVNEQILHSEVQLYITKGES